MMLVVLFSVVGVAVGSWAPAQPAHLPALFLDPHGRPLETAEVINARAIHLQAKALEHSYVPLAHSYLASPLLAHSSLAGHYLKKRSLGYIAAPILSTNYIGGSALTHQSRVDVHSSPAVVAHSVVTPVVSAYSAWPAYGHGHLLKKRSLALAHGISYPIVSYAAPIAVATIPSAVSHQSRVDVHTSPAVLSHSVISPIVSHSVVASPVVSAYSALPAYGAHGHYLKKRSLGYLASPIVVPVSTNYIGGSAVTHESRVDVHSTPAVVSQSVVAPVISAYSALPAYGHGHLLKKRSVLAYGLPAVSHQARVDVISSHAPLLTPLAAAHAIPAAVSHQSRVDLVSPVVPFSHSAVWSAPHSIYNRLALSHW